jgi:hypothetical protein
MYFPYLRGRQFELIALRELLEKRLIGDKIVPIIEPVKLTSTLVKTLNLYVEEKHKVALIMNPQVGNFVESVREKKEQGQEIVEEIYDDLKSECLIKAYLMKRNTSAKLIKRNDIDKLMIVNPNRDCMDEYLKVYGRIEPEFTLVPEDRTFCRKAPISKVLFMDRFPKEQRNSDYSKNEDRFYSEDHLFFDKEGFKGFSDYSIVGADYNESGFAPLAVAIHIVYFDEGKTLRVHHFVSDSNSDINDPAGKFGEALQKLIQWISEANPYMTLGLKSFVECYRTGKYPGLGTVKKYSIMHHMELMSRFLEGEI